jgi:hypothetical protein
MVSLYGNGIDAYMLTEEPAHQQLCSQISSQPGGFIRSFLYPASEANTNLNMQQKLL